MSKPSVIFLSLAIAVTALAPRLAEATCTQSQIHVVPQNLNIGRIVPVIWMIGPPCDVIETGLLLGTDPAKLAPAGQPVYGFRTLYSQSLTVGETGVYWIAAYARDDDFLPQAGNPHFASLRSVDVISQQAFVLDPPSGLTEGNAVHYTGSTRPEEVRAKQAEPLMIGQFSFTPNPADVNQAIGQLDQQFNVPDFFPRPGLYVVICRVELPHPSAGPPRLRCDPDGAAYRQGLGFPFFPSGRLLSGVGYSDNLTDYAGSFRHRTTQTTRSTARFFIPALAPGKRLVRAHLRSFLSLSGDPFGVHLSGRPPLAESQFRCMPQAFLEAPFCFGEGIWDFAADATAIAAGGGGELPVSFDPTPPHTDDMPNPFLHRRYAGYALNLEVNYPLAHDFFGSNSLVLDFESDCPKELKLTVMPKSVRPIIRAGNTMPPALANAPTYANATALVKTCPPDGGTPPPSVEVSFKVQAPEAGSSDAGGHVHDGNRLKGAIDPVIAKCVVSDFDPNGMGSCSVTYLPSEVSGKEKIIAQADGFPDAQASVTVEVPTLQNLATVPTRFWRLTGALPGLHTDNHWGTGSTVSNIQLVALDYVEFSCKTLKTCATLGINDMSLPSGGLFDIAGNWRPDHKWHRTGTSVDIDRRVCVDPDLRGACSSLLPVDRQILARRCRERGRAILYLEGDQNDPRNHCEWPE